LDGWESEILRHASIGTDGCPSRPRTRGARVRTHKSADRIGGLEAGDDGALNRGGEAGLGPIAGEEKIFH